MTQEEYKETVEKVANNPAAYGIRDCILCGRETIAIVGVCFPDTGSELHKKLQEPKGKRRSVFYGMCRECVNSDTPENLSQRIDEILLQNFERDPTITLLTPET